MKKLIAIVIVAAVVAAAGIGIGLSSFTKAPTQPVTSADPAVETPSETSAPETISEADDINSLDNIPGYFGLVNLGYSDQTARYLSSIKLEMISSDNTYYHYVQTTPNGTRSESLLSFTPNEEFDTAGAEKITVSPGFEIYVKHRQVEKLDNGYHVSLAYFIPEENTPADLREHLSTIQQVRGELPFGMKYASAAGTVGTGISLESTVITPIESARTIITTAPVENLGTVLQRQQHADAVREVQQMIMDRDIAQAEAAEAVQRASQTADRQTAQAVDQAIRDQLRQQRLDTNRIIDRAAREEAAQSLSRTAGRVVTNLGTAWSLSNIFDDFVRGYDVLGGARDCWENPTNRLAQDAQRNDPFYERLGEQLDSAEESLYVTSGARAGVVGFNHVAGASTGFLGGMALGSVSQGFDAMLWDGQIDEIDDAIRGITPCNPCPEEQHDQDDESNSEQPGEPDLNYTPGPGDPNYTGLNYTPGPYNPGPRQPYESPEDLVCRPPEFNNVRVLINEIVEEDQGTPRKVTFEARANVTNFVTVGDFTYRVPYFSGNGTGYYHETIGYQYDDGSSCNVEIKGVATMMVDIKRNMSGIRMQLAEVNVRIVGDLPISQNPAGCYMHNGIVPTSTEQIYDPFYECNFFDVDERGGTYHNGTGPDNDLSGAPPWFYDNCKLFMGPLV